MFRPVHATPVPFLYALGNTPAVCLTQDLSPEQSADCLLLGCGDCRNILCTVYYNEKDIRRPLSFTCCDCEPAILSRNILLLSLLLDDSGDQNSKHWAAYYNFLVDGDTLSMIQRQARILVTEAKDLATWHNSVYGHILKMANPESLFKIRKIWMQYADTAKMTPTEVSSFTQQFMKEVKNTYDTYVGRSTVLGGLRSAGPLFLKALDVSPDYFRQFWQTGVTDGLDHSAVCGELIANPMFAFSAIGGCRFVVHYGTDPLAGFHQATAFVDLTEDSPGFLGPYREADLNKQRKIGRVIDAAKKEFRSWCSAFRTLAKHKLAIQSNHLRITCFVGDALSFCNALQSRHTVKQDPLIDASPLSPSGRPDLLAEPDVVGHPAHVALDLQTAVFDVIDTSNLPDHLGLLNILMHSLPLLKFAAPSTLYTEILVHPDDDDSPLERLSRLLCGTLSKLFCLLGVTPIGFLTGVTSTSSIFDQVPPVNSGILSNVKQRLWRIAWKYPTADNIMSSASDNYPEGRKVRWHDDELASTLGDIYDRMFPNEDLIGLFHRMRTVKNALSVIGPFHYSRASFAAFVRFLHRRVEANWSHVLTQFLARVESRYSNIEMGGNCIQDLYLQLHLYDVFTSEGLSGNPRDITRRNFPQSWPKSFRENKKPHNTTCLIFKIPRERLTSIVNQLYARRRNVDIAFQIYVTSSRWENIFSSFRIMFGQIKYSWDDGCYEIVEDEKGWIGVSPLLISVRLPTFMLLLAEPEDIKISLRLQRNPIVSSVFTPELGFSLIVHHTALLDRSQIFPISIPERASWNTPVSETIGSLDLVVMQPEISWNPTAKATIRVNVIGASQKDILSSGAEVLIEQYSQYIAIISCGESIREMITFPLPISGQIRLRIARKSGWIEVITPVAVEDRDWKQTTASMIDLTAERQQRFKLSLSRLNLDIIPQLKLSASVDSSWININVGSMFSIPERSIRERHLKDITSNNVLVDVKENILSLFLCASGGGPRKGLESVFFLNSPSMGGIQTIIFVVGVRLDLLSGTVVADSFVLPLTKSVVRGLRSQLANLAEYGMNLQCTPESHKYWEIFITACVERSRTWKHSCSLRPNKSARGDINDKESFLCACGMGRITPFFRRIKSWSKFIPYVTRAGLSPLFSVPYMESIWPTDANLKADSIRESETQRRFVEIDICWTCGEKYLPLMWCSRCKGVAYCSQECQKKDWKKHKPNCKDKV